MQHLGGSANTAWRIVCTQPQYYTLQSTNKLLSVYIFFSDSEPHNICTLSQLRKE